MPLHIYASGRVCREAGGKGASSRIFLIIIVDVILIIVISLPLSLPSSSNHCSEKITAKVAVVTASTEGIG